MIRWIAATAISRVFGDGFTADLAGRGFAYLADEAGKAMRRDEEQVTLSRLKPGEIYTVIARPRPTRAERKLASAQRSVQHRYDRVSRPGRAQVSAARKLSRTQRRLARTTPGGRRATRLAAREQRQGDRFDHLYRPSRRQMRLARELTELDRALAQEREANFERARTSRGRGRRRPRVRVYD